MNIALNFHSMHYEHGCMVNRGYTCVRPTVCVVHVLYTYKLYIYIYIYIYIVLYISTV